MVTVASPCCDSSRLNKGDSSSDMPDDMLVKNVAEALDNSCLVPCERAETSGNEATYDRIRNKG